VTVAEAIAALCEFDAATSVVVAVMHDPESPRYPGFQIAGIAQPYAQAVVVCFLPSEAADHAPETLPAAPEANESREKYRWLAPGVQTHASSEAQPRRQ
jgi:hypothetical protein